MYCVDLIKRHIQAFKASTYKLVDYFMLHHNLNVLKNSLNVGKLDIDLRKNNVKGFSYLEL